MGPHPLWQLEDLLPDLALRPGDRVLDLGCGRGATSVFLARECGAWSLRWTCGWTPSTCV
ncbi:MAG TPA: hypothetical protein VK038_11955 [Ornithinicoccus sp.]|nr:hypothetical protein [Ornithinicoccus sp.]